MDMLHEADFHIFALTAEDRIIFSFSSSWVAIFWSKETVSPVLWLDTSLLSQLGLALRIVLLSRASSLPRGYNFLRTGRAEAVASKRLCQRVRVI